MNGGLLRRQLYKLDMTVADLASAVGVSPSTVQKMLSGENVSPRTAFRAADAVKLSIEELSPEIAQKYFSSGERAHVSSPQAG